MVTAPGSGRETRVRIPFNKIGALFPAGGPIPYKGTDSSSWLDSLKERRFKPSTRFDGPKPCLDKIKQTKEVTDMLNFLKKEANLTTTENSAATSATTMSDCLDLFSTVGALRAAPEQEIARRFLRAWAEDRDTALKIAFFARDVRGGLGERRVFRVILKTLASLAPESVIKNLDNVPEYGRYDDLLTLLDTPCQPQMFMYIKDRLNRDLAALKEDSGDVSLLAKWLPSVNASNGDTVRAAKRVARALGMTDAAYRKNLSALRGRIAILENPLRERDYTFDYSKQPSRAMFKYRKAFARNDGERYAAFLEQVRSGQAKLNTGALYPYDLVAPMVNNTPDMAERLSLDTAWKALPDYAGGGNALAVVDGSGSMYWSAAQPIPATVALSLGLYFAQRNTGAFHNHFITFSEHPRLVEVKGSDLCEQVKYAMSFNEAANTNIQAVFELILDTAVKNRLHQSDLPETLYFISDMEFDCCTKGADLTNFEYAKRAFAGKGYRLPKVVFWNVASRNLQQPVTMNEQGVALVSGCTPRLFEMVTSGQFSPYQYMMDILDGPRYKNLAA